MEAGLVCAFNRGGKQHGAVIALCGTLTRWFIVSPILSGERLTDLI